MAKSARASVRKRNNANLRATIFGPASDARTERLSAKLQELAAKPSPEKEKAMDIDESLESAREQAAGSKDDDQEMDVNMKGTSSGQKATKKGRSSRIEKKIAKRKPRNKVVFPTSAAKQKRIAQSKRKAY